MTQVVGKVTNQGLSYSESQIADFLIKNKGKRFLMTLEPYSGKKTLQQLGYYFASVIHGAAQYYGWSDSDMHDYLKAECNKKQIVDKNGEIHDVVGSTAVLNKWEYAQFVDRCIVHLAEKGYEVQQPEDYFRQLENSVNQ